MSNAEPDPSELVCTGRPDAHPVAELLAGHQVALGGPRGLPVTRTLPNRTRRMVGAWCFLDSYGPHGVTDTTGMSVPPHPHTGLQTVSWLLAGEIHHRDSLGNEQLVRPGQLNLMTAGRGISHSEVSTAAGGPLLHGVQLWVALPDTDRSGPPAFDHLDSLPVGVDGPVRATVIMGEYAGLISPARTYSPLVAVELSLTAGAASVPLRPDFEYAALPLVGSAAVAGTDLVAGGLLYLGTGRTTLSLSADRPSTVLLLGGEPFAEELVMWWNFVAREHDEIVAQRDAWEAGVAFGTVAGWAGRRLPAPAIPGVRLRPRGRIR